MTQGLTPRKYRSRLVDQLPVGNQHTSIDTQDFGSAKILLIYPAGDGFGPTEIAVGNQADGSDKTPITANIASCLSPVGVGLVEINLNQIYGRYLTITDNTSPGQSILVAEMHDWRSSDQVNASIPNQHRCSIICTSA